MAGLSAESLPSFSGLFRRHSLEILHAGSAAEARSIFDQGGICAYIVVDDLPDEAGLDFVRELHARDKTLPIVLVANSKRHRMPLEEVSVGWAGCYILQDSEARFIKAAYTWIMSALQTSRQDKTAFADGQTEAENRELLHSQRLESVGMLASGIAHDFNNILMAILGNASIAKDRIGKDHEAYRFVDIVEQCAERASALSNSLMRYARGEKADWVPINLPDLVDELLNIISTGLRRHVLIEKDFLQVQPVSGDTTKLQQVIMNICLNAGDAMHERRLQQDPASYVSTLSIRIRPAALTEEELLRHAVDLSCLARGFVRMEISDNGMGMSESTLKNVFRPYFTTKKSGRGLGLSSVQGIIQEHGGFIDVTSVPGSGTTFSIYLPCCEIETPDDAQTLELLTDSAVLVIDPDEEQRRQTGLNLQHRDYQVLLVDSLDEALAIFLEHQSRVSLVLISVANLGSGTMRDLESLHRVNVHTPLVVMNEAESSAAQYLFTAGLATDYVQLPCRPEVLVHVVGDAIRRGRLD